LDRAEAWSSSQRLETSVKLSQTKRAIEAYADGLSAAGAEPASAGLRAIEALLGEFPDEPMSNLVRRGSRAVAGATARTGAGDQSSCMAAIAQLALLAEILTAGQAKKETIKDLIALRKLLSRFGESETLLAVLGKLRDAMKPEPVEHQIERFIERLKEETGTASFEQTFAALMTSPLRREHVVAIAIAVYGRISSGTSRKRALDYIRKPHDAYVSAKRGIEATGGRSAA
jgi:hypothetical protein